MNSNLAKPVLCIALALLLGGCIVTRGSPASGCVESIGFSMAGGCFLAFIKTAKLCE